MAGGKCPGVDPAAHDMDFIFRTALFDQKLPVVFGNRHCKLGAPHFLLQQPPPFKKIVGVGGETEGDGGQPGGVHGNVGGDVRKVHVQVRTVFIQQNPGRPGRDHETVKQPQPDAVEQSHPPGVTDRGRQDAQIPDGPPGQQVEIVPQHFAFGCPVKIFGSGSKVSEGFPFGRGMRQMHGQGHHPVAALFQTQNFVVDKGGRERRNFRGQISNF
jgi:hypothetical protein